MAGTRLVFDVDVCAGDQHASKHCAPGLWSLLDRTPRDCWPTLLRGDKGFGNEATMCEAEQRGLPYLFKLRLTANIKRSIRRLSQQSEWVDAGQGWQATETTVRLQGWSRQRRIIVLRRRVKGALAASPMDDQGQPQLSFIDIGPGEDVYEYSVLATSLVEDLASFGQLYRDRGDGENIFDELKNQWGWGGFVTRDLARCRLAARLVALFYDWWKHLRSSGRAGSASRSRHQPAVAVACNRRTGAPCASNHHQNRQHACPRGSRRQGASRRRPVLARLGQKCGAVDQPATLEGNPSQSLSRLPRQQTSAPPAPPRAMLTHNL